MPPIEPNDELVKMAGECSRSAKKAVEIDDYEHWQYCRDQLRHFVRVASDEPESWVFQEIKAMLDEMGEWKRIGAV